MLLYLRVTKLYRNSKGGIILVLNWLYQISHPNGKATRTPCFAE